MNSCSKCGNVGDLANKFFKLCLKCNLERLKSNKNKDSKTNIKLFKKSFKKPKNSKIKEDEEFYEKCFNMSDHKCEECGCELPDIFKDEDNKIVARWRYSHIIPKSVAIKLRHDTNNINHLCLKHHQMWENGDKKSMKIYAKNSKKFPNYFL